MDSDEEFTFPVVDLYSDASRPKSEGSSVSVREQQKIEDPLWFFSSDFAQRSGNSKKRCAQARLDRITHLMYTKQFEKALTEIQEATARTDSKSIAQDLEECLVKCQLALGNFPEALNTSQRLVQCYRDSFSCWLWYFQSLQATQAEMREQIRALQHCITICPGYAEGYATLASLYSQLGLNALSARATRVSQRIGAKTSSLYPRHATSSTNTQSPDETDCTERSFPDDESIASFEAQLCAMHEPLDGMGEDDKNPALL